MILNIAGIKVPLDRGEDTLPAKVAEIFSIPPESVSSLKVRRRSLDARRNRPPFFVYVVEAVVPDKIELKKIAGEGIVFKVVVGKEALAVVSEDFGNGGKGKPTAPCRPGFPARKNRRVVVGCGPAGLFAALTLVERGLPVLLLERGKELSARRRDVQDFWDRGELNGESNVHFGEGGAGTFSDGKLTSRVKNPHTARVKRTFAELGAPSEILIDAKPHIGTDRLHSVMIHFREKLTRLGCEMRFGARVSDFLIRKGRAVGVVVNGEEIGTDCVILAIGQNADDTYARIHERGIGLAPKPFAIGLRVEHPQELINGIQYGKWRHYPALPPADYFLTAKSTKPDRSVYTFCMCPGGRVIGCSSDPETVVVNGMSGSLRDGPYANSAVVVNVNADDFSGTFEEPLRGLAFRKHWEHKVFLLGGGDYFAPAQRLTDFLHDREGESLPSTSFLPGVRMALLRDTLPPFVTEALKRGFRAFEGKMQGFISDEAVLIGVETRTSSPVRILRDANGQSVNTAGLYPCGEGAGYAGGIISSALDGIRAAESVLASLDVPLEQKF